MPAEMQSNAKALWTWLPVGWLCLVMALSARGIDASIAVMQDFSLPNAALYLVYVSVVLGVVTILWGFYLLGLAFNRSARFPRSFTFWQWTIIAFLLAKQVYVLVTPEFVFSLEGFVWNGGETAIGLVMIVLVNRTAPSQPLFGTDDRARPGLLVALIAAVIGIIVGGAIGAGVGLAAGTGLSEATDMSCFEGACGYFVLLIGLVGGLIGAIGGCIFAVWRINRRKAKPAA